MQSAIIPPRAFLHNDDIHPIAIMHHGGRSSVACLEYRVGADRVREDGELVVVDHRVVDDSRHLVAGA